MLILMTGKYNIKLFSCYVKSHKKRKFFKKNITPLMKSAKSKEKMDTHIPVFYFLTGNCPICS